MKKYLILSIISVLALSAKADIILLHNGDSITGAVKEITDTSIKYIPDGEELIMTIGNQAVNQICLSSGRTETISEHVVINNPKTDWQNITIVYDKDAVKGLVKVGGNTKKANSAWSTNTKKEGLEAKVFEKLKKDCVKQGGLIILVVRKDSQSQGGFGSYGFAEITAEYYTY